MKILLTIFVLFFSSSLVAEQQLNIYGFTSQIPDNYIILKEDDMDDVTQFIEDESMDVSAWNELKSQFSNEETVTIYNIDYLSNEFMHNINFSYSPGEYQNFTNETLGVVCPYFQNILSEIAKTNVTQLKCDISSTPNILGNSIYVEHYGVLPNVASIQYLFWVNKNQVITATLTCIYDDCIKDRIVFKKIMSSIRQE